VIYRKIENGNDKPTTVVKSAVKRDSKPATACFKVQCSKSTNDQ